MEKKFKGINPLRGEQIELLKQTGNADLARKVNELVDRFSSLNKRLGEVEFRVNHDLRFEEQPSCDCGCHTSESSSEYMKKNGCEDCKEMHPLEEQAEKSKREYDRGLSDGLKWKQEIITLEISKILSDIHAGKFGTKNRSELISRLQGITL